VNVYFILMASNNPVISCDNVHINQFSNFFQQLSRMKLSTRKLKEYYLHQSVKSVDSKKSADLSL